MEGGGIGSIGLLVQSEGENMCSGLMENPTGTTLLVLVIFFAPLGFFSILFFRFHILFPIMFYLFLDFLSLVDGW